MGDRGARNEDISPRVLDDMKRDLINVWQRSVAGQTEVFESFAVACVRLALLRVLSLSQRYGTAP
jgi:hypothetical protein